MSIAVNLENFSGPLDLLLHLVKTSKMDICEIQIVEITEQYLHIMDQMKRLDLDVAGEFLLMAATLIHIKSRILLPFSDEVEEEEGEDPREELIRRLLEYQRYQEAAELFNQLPWLGRDVFTSEQASPDPPDATADGLQIRAEIYQLAAAFHRLMSCRPVEAFHEVIRETLTVAEYIEFIVDRLKKTPRLALRDFVPLPTSRGRFIVTFLAMLELVKMRLIKVDQVEVFSEVWVTLAVPPEEVDAAITGKVVFDYA